MGHVFNQVLVGTGLMMCIISDTFIIGQMSGMIDELQTTDDSIKLTKEDISWIASSMNVLFTIGSIILSVVSDSLGRRKAINIVNLIITMSWILLYFAYDKTTFFISRIIFGICFGGCLILVFTCISEYQSPQFRVLCLNLITGVGSVIGTLSGHALGVVLNWRNVALIGIIPSGLSAILPIFWKESPAWLASKGKFDECEKAFRGLHTLNTEAKNEIQLLVTYERRKQSEVQASAYKGFLSKNVMVAIKQTYFWRIALFSTVIVIYRVASCRMLFSALAITMLREITGTHNILLFTLVVDGLPVIGVILSWIIFSKFKIRTIVFTWGVLADIFFGLFALSLYLWPENDNYLSWIKICLLTLYFMTLSAGPGPALDSLSSEILPVELKPFFIFWSGVFGGCLQSLSIKFAAPMLTNLGYHGLFFFYAAIVSFCLIYFWFFMPETKGRSLHEIEYFFRHNTFDYRNDLFQKNQSDILLDTKGRTGRIDKA